MAAVRSADASKCHLLDLPPELRLVIYELLFPQKPDDFYAGFVVRSRVYSIGWKPFGENEDNPSYDPRHFETAILRTCRFINAEATPVLYKSSTFKFDIDDKTILTELDKSVPHLLMGRPKQCAAWMKQARYAEIALWGYDRGTQDMMAWRIQALLATLIPDGKLERLHISLDDLRYEDEPKDAETEDAEQVFEALEDGLKLFSGAIKVALGTMKSRFFERKQELARRLDA